MSHEISTGRPTPASKPVQILSWNQKDEDWFKQNIEYFISRATNLHTGSDLNRKDLGLLYRVYNNQFPLEWFQHVTDPLNAKNPQHKKFPAKIRPVTILRSNIDLLLGEYPHRPFVFTVENQGETGYSRYQEGMADQARQTLTEHFIQAALDQMQTNGQQLTPQQMQQLQQDPPIPDQVKAEFKASFKDLIAIKGQKWLNRVVQEHEVKRKMHKMFKDWLIAGQAYSYKGVENDRLVYKRISPLNLDFDKSEENDYVEDGEWAVHLDYYTLSDVVDQFYQVLEQENLENLERLYQYANPMNLYKHLSGQYGKQNKIPVHHVQWKGRKKIGFLTAMDPESFQMVEDVVDEDYKAAPGESIEWKWVNEVYEGWRIGADIYTMMRAAPIQRSEMNNHSSCKLSYNGRKYSDTHAESLAILEMGIPFQILYIIVTYTLEKTIAKSKGKILLMDQNTIPDEEEWDEEKFFYYSEALGYALLNRNQPGVDKSWNQYQVVDMGLFDQIKQLIELQAHFKQEWDDLIGMARQRKGQTFSSDGQGVNERAVFQSTVITDMIFLGFEEFRERDLQGLLDLSKFLTAKGVYGTWNNDDFGTEIMEILPEDFMNEDLGVFVQMAAEQIRRLNEMKQLAQSMLQNASKPSTVFEVIDSVNVAELKAKLKQIEEIEAQIEQQTQTSEQDAQAAADQRKMKFMEYEKMLDRQNMNAEYDRKEDIEMIKGDFSTFTFQDGDSNNNNVPDALEVQKLLHEKQKTMIDATDRTTKRDQEQQKIDLKQQELEHNIKNSKVQNNLKAKQIKVAAKKAAQRPATKK